MATLSPHHMNLDDRGVGKCSKPMWSGGCPAGFCDEPAYGPGGEATGYGPRGEALAPYLACPAHGGPPRPSGGPLFYEAKESLAINEWVVEAIDYDGEGEVYVTNFSGPAASERAREYAAWKNVPARLLRVTGLLEREVRRLLAAYEPRPDRREEPEHLHCTVCRGTGTWANGNLTCQLCQGTGLRDRAAP